MFVMLYILGVGKLQALLAFQPTPPYALYFCLILDVLFFMEINKYEIYEI